MPKQVIRNIVEEGADLMLNRNEQLPDQLSEIENELNELVCGNSKISNWIAKFEFDNLIDIILESSDEYFHKRFCSDITPNQEEREKLAQEVKNHVEVCAYCEKIIARDDLLKQEVNDAFHQNVMTAAPRARRLRAA